MSEVNTTTPTLDKKIRVFNTIRLAASLVFVATAVTILAVTVIAAL